MGLSDTKSSDPFDVAENALKSALIAEGELMEASVALEKAQAARERCLQRSVDCWNDFQEALNLIPGQGIASSAVRGPVVRDRMYPVPDESISGVVTVDSRPHYKGG